MTQEHEDLLALAAAHLLDPACTGQRLAATVRCYIKDVRPAFRYLAAHGISAALARPTDLQQYLDSLAGCYRPTTIRRKSVSLRAVYLALAETGAIPHNPTHRRPAIVLPWYGPQGLTALKYRFLDSQGRQDRFGQLRGGQQIFFGGHLVGQQCDTLILCEGELNAVAIWQAVYPPGDPAVYTVDGQVVDVVSFGSQGTALAEPVLVLARRYRRVILWADETAPVRVCLAALGARAFGLKSPLTADEPPVKLDANALLQRGLLGELLRRALCRFQVVAQAVSPPPVALIQPEPSAAARPAAGSPSVTSKVAALPAPQLNRPVRIPLDYLSEYLTAHHLRVVGGDPGLGRWRWRPMLYLAERADHTPEEN
jgi:hypothetical protein